MQESEETKYASGMRVRQRTLRMFVVSWVYYRFCIAKIRLEIYVRPNIISQKEPCFAKTSRVSLKHNVFEIMSAVFVVP